MPSEHARSMNSTEWSLLLTLSVLWGSSFFFFKLLVAELPPFTVVLGRVGAAALLLNAYLWLRRIPMSATLPWRQFIVMGTLNNVIPFSLIVWGETRVSSGLASILNATTPVFAVLVAHAFTPNEKLTMGRASGVLLGLIGVVVLVGPDVRDASTAPLVGEAACLAAAFSYALAGIYGRRFKGLPSMHVATGQLTASTLVMLPLAAASDRPWMLPMPSGTVWGAFAGIAVLCTVFAYLIYFRLLATAGATNLMLVTFLLPVSAMLLGHLVLGERVTLPAVSGMAVIGLSLVCIDGRALAALKRRVTATEPP